MEDVSKGLETAVREDRLEIVSELIITYGLSYSPDWDEGYELLRLAVMYEHSEIAKLLLTRGAKVNSENYRCDTLVHDAAEHGDLETIEMILDKGGLIEARNHYGETPIFKSIHYQKLDFLELLLKRGANVNASDIYGVTPLHLAARNGDLEIVELLLNNGANIDARNKSGETPLHKAINFHRNRKIEVAKLLLKHGANVLGDKYGTTPLHLAAWYGELEIVETMLDKSDIETRDKYGRTVLHDASCGGSAEVVKLLLERGAKVNSKTNIDDTPMDEDLDNLWGDGSYLVTGDTDGRTALHIASEESHAQVVQILLNNGADINNITIDNRKPLDFARHEPTIEALIFHIVKLKSATLYISKENLQSIPDNINKYSDFQDECVREIANMKRDKFNNLTISFFDILTKTNSLPTYMRNDTIVEDLKSGEYKLKFPIYANMIESNFRKAMERKELLEEANPIFHFLFNNFPELPFICVKKIFSYLTNEDLTVLIASSKPLSSKKQFCSSLQT